MAISDDDDFEPRLGKGRARGSPRGRRYLQRVLRSWALAGGRAHGAKARRGFTGSRIGRGAGAGRVLRDRYGAFRARRVVVKSRIVKLGAAGLGAARAHLRYIQRDGVTREGLPGAVYDASQDRADGKAFLARCDGDRHQFRFIVAAEDGVEYEDLKDLTRRLMRRVEADLGTRLDWVAVDHHNTGHPHTHIVMRGKDDRGRDLVIARDYIGHGMRARAAEIVTLDLGPRTDLEVEARLRQEVEQDRFTSLDRGLLRAASADGRLDLGGPPSGPPARFHHALRAGRLQKLKRLGLAEEAAAGAWRLAPGLEQTLRRMGEREDIVKTMHRALTREQPGQGTTDYAIYSADDGNARRLVGRVVERGLADELHDRHYLIVDGVDGRAHWVGIGAGDAVEPIPAGAIVAVTPKRVAARPADRTIAEVAAANRGRYDVAAHLRHDPRRSPESARMHARRLEALQRAALVERHAEGGWAIPGDFPARAAAYERTRAGAALVAVEILTTTAVAQQVAADAATWLDRQLTSDEPALLRDLGFGREVRTALMQRRQWLIAEGLAETRGDRVFYRRGMVELLRRRELARIAAQLSGELGLAYEAAPERGRVDGIYRRRLDLVSGRFAVLERSREFTLVPWRPSLERGLGKSVAGVLRGETISWTVAGLRGPARD